MLRPTTTEARRPIRPKTIAVWRRSPRYVAVLVVEQRQVDVGRAFRGAGFAGQTVFQGGGQGGRIQGRLGIRQPSFQNSPDGVGATARGHDLATGGDVSGAHHGGGFEAAAAAVALFEVADKRMVAGRKGQNRGKRQDHFLAGALAQVGVYPVAAIRCYFSRIQQPLRVEESFDLPHRAQQRFTQLAGHEFGARDADPVLGGQGAVELADQTGDFSGNQPQMADPFGRVQIEHRAHVQKAGGGMSVITGRHSQGLEDGLQAGHVSGQVGGPNSRVFDASDRLGRPRTASEQRQPRLAQVPNQVHFRGGGDHLGTQSQAARGQRRQFVAHLVKEFHNEDGFTGSGLQFEQVPRRLKRQLAAGLVE